MKANPSYVKAPETSPEFDNPTGAPNQPDITNLEIYYDGITTAFWVHNDRNGWIKVTTQDVKARLAKIGYSRQKGLGAQQISQVDLALIRIQESHDVDYVGSLAGYKTGVYVINESRILVRDSPRLIVPIPGDWPLLKGIIFNMLGQEQQMYLFGWLKVAIESLYEEKPRVGQAFALCGPKDCGKSLLQELITKLLGNRSQKAHRYMDGDTPFNGELFGTEHLIIEDDKASTDIRSRRHFGTHIKEIAANTTHSCHSKHRQALKLSPSWRLSISVNEEPENLMILPPMDDSLEDKIIILKAAKHPMPMPTVTPQEREIFMRKLEAELSHFASFLLDWKIPDNLTSQRYGVTHFHHPDILQALGALSPENRLLEMVDAELFNSCTPVPWRGTAAELERRLTSDNSEVKRSAPKVFTFQAACGTYLARLQKLHKDRFNSTRINGTTIWTIQPLEE
jgi:hypothetical protein